MVLRIFALLTTKANEMMRPIHHRMPVIIETEDVVVWMAGDAEMTAKLMRHAGEEVLRVWRISRAVSDIRNDGPDVLSPLEGGGAFDLRQRCGGRIGRCCIARSPLQTSALRAMQQRGTETKPALRLAPF